MGRSSKNKKRKRSLDNNDISSSSTVAAADVAPVSTIIKTNNNQNQKQKKIKKKKQKTSKSRLRSEQQQQRFWNEDCKDLPLLSNYNNNCGSSIGTKREWTAETEFNTIKNVIDIEWLMTDDDDDDKEQVNINPIPLNEEDEVFETIKNCKQAFEDIPSFLFTKARRLTNKFEVLGKGRRFINRSAMKLANMDHFLKLIIPPPSSESKAESSSSSDDDCHFVGFADLCGGPGLVILYYYYNCCYCCCCCYSSSSE